MTLRAPAMVCTKNCWPAVRDALQQQPGVTEVKLAPQKEEVAIDNPLVTISLNGPFDTDKAIAAIAAAGFAKATAEKRGTGRTGGAGRGRIGQEHRGGNRGRARCASSERAPIAWLFSWAPGSLSPSWYSRPA